MILKLVKLLVALHVLFINQPKFMVMGLSKQVFEAEKELQVSSGYVKTIQLEGGDIGDCIEMDKQPTLSHPLLKNHKIQMMKQSKTRSKNKAACPPGTVLIPTTTIKKDFQSFLSVHPNAHRVEVGTKEDVGIGSYHGGIGIVSVYNLSLTGDQISSANIWLKNGPADQNNVIMAGRMVAPSILGDSRPRLFTYWTEDTGRNTGCFNFLCKGFVQTGTQVGPGSLLSPVSTYNGTTYDLKIRIFQDIHTSNWVLTVFNDDIVVAYWPKELFPYLSKGARYVGWGGLAKEGQDGISPPMGSGHKPNGYYNTAAYFEHIRYYNVNLNENQIPYDDSKEFVDETGCYGLQNEKRKSQTLRDSFLFGGPGGKCRA